MNDALNKEQRQKLTLLELAAHSTLFAAGITREKWLEMASFEKRLALSSVNYLLQMTNQTVTLQNCQVTFGYMVKFQDGSIGQVLVFGGVI